MEARLVMAMPFCERGVVQKHLLERPNPELLGGVFEKVLVEKLGLDSLAQHDTLFGRT